MNSHRIKKVNSLLKEVISEAIQKDWKNYALEDFVTITHVETSKDIRHATVYVSLLSQDPTRREKIIQVLQEAAGYIAVLASKKVSLRYFPELSFKLDDSLEHYMKIDSLLKNLEKKK